MLVDSHCHINMMVKKKFDLLMTQDELGAAQTIVEQAAAHDVTAIINVGTSVVESKNCVALAQRYDALFAAVGLHPNDCSKYWLKDFEEIEQMVKKESSFAKASDFAKASTDRSADGQARKIVAIGESGIDLHYPDYDLQRQKDAFKAHIELALEHDLALVVHSRDAYDETLRGIEEFKGQIKRGIIHCFSEDQAFADQVIEWGLVIGIGGTITYPKNKELRDVVTSVPMENIILETDAPFLPPQVIRGKQNHPEQIRTIAEYLAELRGVSYEEVANTTTSTVKKLFRI